MVRLYNYIGPAWEKTGVTESTVPPLSVKMAEVAVLDFPMSLTVSVDVKQHLTMLRHWSQPVSIHPSMATDIPVKLYIVESSWSKRRTGGAAAGTRHWLTRAARRLGLLKKLEQAIKFQTDHEAVYVPLFPLHHKDRVINNKWRKLKIICVYIYIYIYMNTPTVCLAKHSLWVTLTFILKT